MFAQSDVQEILDAEKAFAQAAAKKGMKFAFLDIFADDSVIFRPDATNGRGFWTEQKDSSPALLVRNPAYADIASNGLLGYTTGSWELRPKGKTDPYPKFGQYVTIWEKKPDGRFRATLDIGITHEKPSVSETNRRLRTGKSHGQNKSGWSAADASMNFLRVSMSRQALSGAYEQFADYDVRLLREYSTPIIGKRRAVKDTKHYMSIDFPKKVNLYQSADMAYVWNPCEYAVSNEGTEKGNCLHVWKLRDKKWWIVLGIFAPFPNETVPTLKEKEKNKSNR